MEGCPLDARILVVDDEPQMRRALRASLRGEGYQVEVAASGAEALQAAQRLEPHLLLLDLGLPDMDGAEVCARLRTFTQAPIIVLSVRETEADKVQALDRGADDYLVKPFGIGELLARIRAALRRHRDEVGPASIQHGELRIDLEGHQVERQGERIHLTPTEFELLAYLATRRGRVLTHRMILRHVWGPEYEEEVQYLRVFVSQLRRKIERDARAPRYLLTEVGVGYRFPAADGD